MNLINNNCRYNGKCEYRCNDLPMESDIEKLINGLNRQIEIMESNAAYLQKLYPELEKHIELIGAAKITQEWLDNIEDT
jgi:hypothetical protein